MKLRFYILWVLFIWSAAALAQDTKFTASVSSDQVTAGEQFEIIFSTSEGIDSFNPPSFNGFQVLGGPNQSSSYSSVNGVTTSSVSVSYVLTGMKEGEYVIGSAEMISNGKRYKSNTVRIKVVKGRAVSQNSGQSASGSQDDEIPAGNSSDLSKSVFLRAVANKTNVYQGEQISVSYKLYTNVNLVGSEPGKSPDFNGFWSQEIKNNSSEVPWEIEDYNGKRYHVAVLKQIVLFPERYGRLTLDPLSMTLVVRQTVPTNDPIEQFFGNSFKDLKYKVSSAPVTINVKPLPEEGKPMGFNGAVGNFSLQANADKMELKANEALNYIIKITGSGNLKLLKAPELNLNADIEKYDPKVTDNITEAVSGVSGSREFTYLLIPRHEGNYTIEPLKFSYFNPVSQRYITLTAKAFPLKVAKGAPGSNVTAFSGSNQQDIKMLNKDIAYIKTGAAGLSKSGEGFYGSVLYYILLACGPIVFIGALGFRKWYRDDNKDEVLVRGRNANKLAAKHLSNARKQLLAGDKKVFYEDIYKGLYGYLSDKLNISYADLNQENIREQLKLRSVNDALINQLTDTLNLCEMARYAPVSGILEKDIFDKAKNIINDIENNA